MQKRHKRMKSLTQSQIVRFLSEEALKYFFPGIEIPSSERTEVFLSMMPRPTVSASRRFFRELSCAEPEDQDQDDKTRAFIKELEALQEKYGVTIEELEALLAYKVKLSRLRITRSHDIILEDFDHVEVKMDKLTKSVFLLFLRHPEGIRYKDLPDFEEELSEIYMSISGRSDLEAMKKSISDLTDTVMSNSINEKVSKAKKAFRNVVDERVAKFYYIDGKQGETKSIPLDRSLVIWD